jgi:hypothetical protein
MATITLTNNSDNFADAPTAAETVYGLDGNDTITITDTVGMPNIGYFKYIEGGAGNDLISAYGGEMTIRSITLTM